MAAKRKRQKNKQDRRSIMTISAIVIALSVAITVFFCVQTNNIDRQNRIDAGQIAELENRLEAEKNRTEEIEAYGKYVNTKQFIELMARQKLGLIYPGEIIFKPVTE